MQLENPADDHKQTFHLAHSVYAPVQKRFISTVYHQAFLYIHELHGAFRGKMPTHAVYRSLPPFDPICNWDCQHFNDFTGLMICENKVLFVAEEAAKKIHLFSLQNLKYMKSFSLDTKPNFLAHNSTSLFVCSCLRNQVNVYKMDQFL